MNTADPPNPDISTADPPDPDLTSIVEGSGRPWLPIPGYAGAYIKVLVADERLNQVVFMFKFEPGTVLPRHKHLCHAVGYTLSGEWQYEEGVLREGSLAYEPFGSTHTPSSPKGAEIVTFLKSEDDRFLENELPDGSTLAMDMKFFKFLQSITPEQAQSLDLAALVGKR